MINYVVYKEIIKRVDNSANLSKILLDGRYDFSIQTINYLKELLEFSQANQFYFTSDVSTAINQILTFKPSVSSTGTSRHLARQEKDACASQALKTVIEKIKENIEEDKNTFNKCLNYLVQSLNTIKIGIDLNQYSDNEKMNLVEQVMSSDENYRTIRNQIIGVAGMINYRLLLAIAIGNSN